MYTELRQSDPVDCKEADRTHETVISNIGVALQVEEHRHIILVVRSIKASDIDRRAP